MPQNTSLWHDSVYYSDTPTCKDADQTQSPAILRGMTTILRPTDAVKSRNYSTDSRQQTVFQEDATNTVNSTDSRQQYSTKSRQQTVFQEDATNTVNSTDSRQQYSTESRQQTVFQEDATNTVNSTDSRQQYSTDSRQQYSTDSRQQYSTDSRQQYSTDSRQQTVFQEDATNTVNDVTHGLPDENMTSQPISSKARQKTSFSAVGIYNDSNDTVTNQPYTSTRMWYTMDQEGSRRMENTIYNNVTMKEASTKYRTQAYVSKVDVKMLYLQRVVSRYKSCKYDS
ncbi:serine-rich adhesin for platelets-like [Ptychodera flava]|uniref:serine-rich adhesin for platelets-like n=1 Tax=Ptychodera flava TaxID=63121 RepID=UPI00396A83D2